MASAAARSLTDSFYERLRHRDPAAVDAALRAASLPPDFTGRPSTRSAGGGDPDPDPQQQVAAVVPTAAQRDHDALRLRGIL
jgi:hypothetical protein